MLGNIQEKKNSTINYSTRIAALKDEPSQKQQMPEEKEKKQKGRVSLTRTCKAQIILQGIASLKSRSSEEVNIFDASRSLLGKSIFKAAGCHRTS